MKHWSKDTELWSNNIKYIVKIDNMCHYVPIHRLIKISLQLPKVDQNHHIYAQIGWPLCHRYYC